MAGSWSLLKCTPWMPCMTHLKKFQKMYAPAPPARHTLSASTLTDWGYLVLFFVACTSKDPRMQRSVMLTFWIELVRLMLSEIIAFGMCRSVATRGMQQQLDWALQYLKWPRMLRLTLARLTSLCTAWQTALRSPSHSWKPHERFAAAFSSHNETLPAQYTGT